MAILREIHIKHGAWYGFKSGSVGHCRIAWMCYSLSLLSVDVCILRAFHSLRGQQRRMRRLLEMTYSACLCAFVGIVSSIYACISFPHSVSSVSACDLNASTSNIAHLWCCSNAVCWAHIPSPPCSRVQTLFAQLPDPTPDMRSIVFFRSSGMSRSP